MQPPTGSSTGHQTFSFLPSTMPNALTISRSLMIQPHMSTMNLTGTSGFRSPMLPVHSVPAISATWTSTVSSGSYQSCPTSSASIGFQFPAPTFHQQSFMPQCSNSVLPVMSATVYQSPWTCPQAWNQLTNDSGFVQSTDGNNSVRTHTPVQFCGRQALNQGKRKSTVVEEIDPGHKVFIDEERMAGHMRELNLDNNNLNWHPDLEDQPWYSQPYANTDAQFVENTTDDSSQNLEEKSNKLPQLELSKAVELIKCKDLLPKSILQEIQKPALQVVLWKPPGSFVEDILPPAESQSTQTPDECNSKAEISPFPRGELPAIPLVLPSDTVMSAEAYQVEEDMDL